MDKHGWRAHLLAARRALPPSVHSVEAAALLAHVHGLLASGLVERGDVVCAYVPQRHEPGGAELLDVLLDSGVRVLLPVTPAQPGPLDWAAHTGPGGLAIADRGLREPTGVRLGPGAVGLATVVLVPALAMDTTGNRLGRGGGFYDRTLPAADPAAALVGVVRDAELVAALPVDEHDVRLRWALTPHLGLVPLGG
ncbi:MAG: 5-formyltetrahydrofolate cyclo-ligase [Mycobacteriaceae bacterium]